MKTVLPLLINIIIAAWVAIVAIISVQNATPVSLQFMIFESIEMPVGVVLAFGLAVGLVLGAIAVFIYRQGVNFNF